MQHFSQVALRRPTPALFRFALAIAFTAGANLALAQDAAQVRETNALQDIARSQRHQAEYARRRDQRDSERAYRERNDYVNAKRDARSLRRFDRP